MKDARKVLTGLRVVLGGVLLWIVLRKTSGWSFAKDVLQSPAVVFGVVVLTVIAAYLEALRLAPLLRTQGLRITTREAFRLATAAFSFNFCIPGGASGDLSKVYYLSSAKSDKSWELATIVFLDRFVGLLSMLLLMVVFGVVCWPAVVQSPVFTLLLTAAVILLCAMVLFLILCLSAGASRRPTLLRLIAVLPFHRQLERIASALLLFSRHKRTLLASIAFSFAGNIANAAVFTLFGWELFSRLDAPMPALIAMFGMFANTITITPGGLGVGEAAFETLFLETGVAGGAGMMLLWRICMVPLCLLGLAFYMGGLRIQPEPGPSPELPA